MVNSCRCFGETISTTRIIKIYISYLVNLHDHSAERKHSYNTHIRQLQY